MIELPTIYNFGGGSGGGAYSDGGALVDSDFIKVENNTISTYKNTSRSDINYYFDVADGEVLNAVIELTNDVNATVHIYINQNGLYIPLGNIGGDTVSAGNDYKVNITGHSFIIGLVTGLTNEPEYINIDGYIFGVKKINNYYWTTENLKLGNDFGVYKDKYGQRYYQYSDALANLNVNGFVIPDESAFNDLIIGHNRASLASVDLWYSTPGTNTTGFNAKPYGIYRTDNIVESYTTAALFCVSGQTPPNAGSFYITESTTGFGSANNNYRTIRLCKHV